MPDLEKTIRRNAKAPAKASGDAGSVEQHPLKDQIEADSHLALKKASRVRGRGRRRTKLFPPRSE